MAFTGDGNGRNSAFSMPTHTNDFHPASMPPSDLFLSHSFVSHGSQPHLPTPSSPNSRIDTFPQDPFESPSRSVPDEQNSIEKRTPQPFHNPSGLALSGTGQMATPESSPMLKRLPSHEGNLSYLSGMYRSTPITLAPAPVISPSSGRRTVQMLSETVSPPETPTPSLIRPEYMRRLKRSRTDPVVDNEDSGTISHTDLGIANSPTKGRVLKLFESVDHGESPHEQHPHGFNISTFRHSILFNSTPTPPPKTPEISVERQQRIERRMTAFSSSSSSPSRLFPAEVPGRGRVLINSLTDLGLFATPSPSPHRAGVKKTGRSKRTIVRSSSSPIPSVRDAENLQEAIAATASWPDQEFPWSLHTEQRVKRRELLQQERMSKIRRFLEQDSDGDDEDKESSPKVIRRRRLVDSKRGQPVARQPDKGNSSSGASFNPVLDSADAKEVLRASRWASSHPAPGTSEANHAELLEEEEGDLEEDDGILKCVCGTQEDRPMVRCDTCKFWYHQDCMSIVNEEELEEEWFCFSCLNNTPPPPPVREPTLVPTNEDHSVTKANTHLPLYQVDDLSFPPSSGTPRARTHGEHQKLSSFFQTPRAESSHTYRNAAHQSQTSSSNPNTPNRISGKTGFKVWATPSLFEDVTTTAAPDSPFDPTSTPSRGMKFGIPLISTATPKDFGAWSTRMGGLFATPFQLGRSAQPSDSGRRTFDLSDFTPGMPSWNNSPLALASSSAKGQILEFGGDLVVPQGASTATANETSTSGQSGNGDTDGGSLAPAAQIHEGEPKD